MTATPSALRGVVFMVLAVFLAVHADDAAADSQQNPVIELRAVQAGVTAEVFEELVSAAFAGRQWVVLQTQPGRITGQIQHRGTTATVAVMRTAERAWIADIGHAEHDPAPARWLEYLKRDLNFKIATANAQDTLAQQAEQQLTIAERLQRLDALRDQGLLTQDEYDAKRAQILAEL